MSDQQGQGFPRQHQPKQPGDEHRMQPEPEFIRSGYVGSNRMEHKHCVITGGDSGIGRAVAVHFAAEGAASVAIVYREERADAEETRALVEERGTTCRLIEGDAKEPEFPRRAIEEAAAGSGGRIDVLVNNAAVQWPQSSIEDITLEQIETTFRTNIFAYFLFTQAALKAMQPGAAIVNTTSITAYRGSSVLLDYSATKGAIVSFTRSLSQQLVKREIRVNGVAPGPIWTPLIPATFDEEKVASFGKSTPMGRAGQPSEVAPCYVFLASADASYITGHVLHPNGGDFITT